jgi:hypothetical protein
MLDSKRGLNSHLNEDIGQDNFVEYISVPVRTLISEQLVDLVVIGINRRHYMRVISLDLLPHVISHESIANLRGMETVDWLDQLVHLSTLRGPDLNHLYVHKTH